MVKIFLDGCDAIFENKDNDLIEGFTTNPALMLKAGVTNYHAFALKVLDQIKAKPISFEVLSDDFHEMVSQAFEIDSWADNVYVKIPITNTEGATTYPVIRALTQRGVKVNVTAIMTLKQVDKILPALRDTRGAYISVFAGRIADTGINPVPIMSDVKRVLPHDQKIELIWASPREVFNIYQANVCQCDIITCGQDIIKKIPLRGKDLEDFSLETVRMFYRDGQSIRFR